MMLKKPLPFLQLVSILLLLILLPICAASVKMGDLGPSSSTLMVGEEEEEMMMMESEISRRMLAMQRRYISYETLKRDMVPCDNPGASYYDCHRSRPANAYNRGCEVITRCARDIKDVNA